MTAPQCPSVAPNGTRCSWPAEHAESWHSDADGLFNWMESAQ